MKKIYGNPCCRCGKERIHVRTWKEKVGGSVIINVEHACPDELCQQKVTAENKKQGLRYAQMKAQSEKRAEERKSESKNGRDLKTRKLTSQVRSKK